ncbi:MAG: fatty acid kinase fatty acid binding subunit [Frankiaceae bacterium]|nr:fatty acid kinase fatty acid binding subunit [Frankiaceae bacterium]
MARVAVVTDSTNGLPAELIEKYDVRVVPLQVVLGGRLGADGIDVTPADVAAALRAHVSVSTSRPTPTSFQRVYADAADEGHDAVVSVHLSAGLSGTCDAARVAAADAPVPVRVIDSTSTAMGLGFPVLAAAEAAAAGAGIDEVAGAATDAIAGTKTLFYVNSLDALRRGGRLGQAASLVGSALAVKPLLHVVDGRIALCEKVRTATKALLRLEELATADVGDASVDVAVHHLAAADKAAQFVASLRAALPGLASAYVTEVGAVLGAHVGLGLLGVVVHRR